MHQSFSILLLFLLILGCSINKSQGLKDEKQNQALHPIVQKAKATSLYSNTVNWQEINKKFIELTANQEAVEALKPGLQYLINSLGDKHGSFRLAKDHSVIAYYTGIIEEEDTRDPTVVNTIINDINAKFSHQLIQEDIGYLKVVGIGPSVSIQEAANFIRKGLQDLVNQGAKKWILDLRYNSGGNMNPMLAGLAPLIGDGLIGGAVDANKEIFREYYIREGQFYDTENLVCEMPAAPQIPTSAKVAVLLSRYTISAGEIVALAFKGRPNTRFIGEATAGYTTGNGYEQVTDELIMTISQAIQIDRHKVAYDKVGVDENSEFIPLATMVEDQQIISAIQWLTE